MKVLRDEIDFIKFRLFKSVYEGKKKNGKTKVAAAGTIVEIPIKNWLEALNTYGPLSNLDPIDVPELGDYEVVVKGTYKNADDKRFRTYEPGDIIRLKKADAIHLMLQAGKVKPVDKSVPDLSVFCSFKYKAPTDPESLLRSKPKEEQEKDRQAEEKKQREKEKAVYQAKEELDGFKKKKSFSIKGW